MCPGDEAGESGDATAISPDANTEPSTPPSPTVDASEQNEDATSMKVKNGDNDYEIDTQERNGTINPRDDILHQAVCNALVDIKDDDLPMTTANFYAQHVKPRSDHSLEIKMTSWKKLGSYLQEQQDNGMLSIKAHSAWNIYHGLLEGNQSKT